MLTSRKEKTFRQPVAQLAKLLVYGTLKAAYGNHRIIQGAELLGTGYLQDFGIFSLGGFPGITPRRGRTVVGELYEITKDMLDMCDRLEGVDHRHPFQGLYRREKHPVTYQLEGAIVATQAYVYVYNGRSGEFIESGVWDR